MLIADSGSTKTDWILVTPRDGIFEIHTQGINPVRDGKDAILRVLEQELLPQLPASYSPARVRFFGAGCIDPFRASVLEGLQRVFPQSEVHADSDLLGAAVALCGNQPGVACILGTGSNSCLYDGERIVQNVSPLGYILGDEGSGAVLGKTLIGCLLKGDFPSELRQAFFEHFQLTQADVIERVYRQPMPNRFLASLVPFIQLHRHVPQVHQMLVDAFRLFFQRNIRHYGASHMPINFVGSIAFIYRDELREAAQAEGYELGKIIQRPAPEIANFYQKTCYTA